MSAIDSNCFPLTVNGCTFANMIEQRTIIVTGAGSGIGRATAQRLGKSGWRVFATMRRPDAAVHGPGALALDVTNDESVATAVATVMERTGRIDAIVNNAGVDMTGAVEETSTEEAQALFQTNFFGVHRLIRAAPPIMRAQGRGRIVTIGSIGGFLPMPFGAFYSAAKHALEGYSETLAYEVAPFGIRCLLIEPGFIKTDLRDKKRDVSERLDAYSQARAKADRGLDASVGSGITPDHVAEVVERALDAAAPKLRQRVGRDAHALAAVRRFLPDAVFQAGLRRRY
jgi:NAD(P)-dependent dehydrogenase (short-subunit alcohol dehydrogenase family)